MTFCYARSVRAPSINGQSWVALLFALLAVLAILAVPAQADTSWKLVKTYPHDPTAFTEGLFFHDGALYESTGLEGRSDIRKVSLNDGKVVERRIIPQPYFGEGIVNWKDRLISLTWRHRQGFVWKLSDFSPVSGFRYEGEGWGLTQDGRNLIMSDGTAQLRFIDPESLSETRRITVTFNGRQVDRLNELEYVKGEIWANIWYDTHIVRIDPATGRVIDWIDIGPLAKTSGATDDEAVANGIAYDAKQDRLFITGKYWPKLFEIKLQPGR